MLTTAHRPQPESPQGIQEKDELRNCMWDMIDRAGGYGEAFIRPIPPEQIRSWIDHFCALAYPRGNPDDYDLFGIYDPLEDPRCGMTDSMGILSMVVSYTERAYPFEKGNMMQDKTYWRYCSPNTKRLSSSTSDVHSWIVKRITEQCDPATAQKYTYLDVPRSSTLPHLSCFVHDDEILQDDGSLSNGELTAIMVLALRQSSDRTYRHATVIPLLVFSCSGRQVRIIQGCIDFRNYQFDVRCSEILDFNEGGIRGTDENLRRFYTLLGWVLGEPVGNIEQSQVPGSRR
ncbi:hypothetical protein ISF_04594 [Cordyceps fumosorosea ARSEF 2679]|uniref:Uncharacterized protein n=1 Tax=Cordyceps fumosorosea (strain ARSEF 2679) TaxID=1081104 RepID=A0A167WJX0_CORFA|nr:hypothetical protein ISF_04594 [Cordyceps fumosorosea ARSEF 2679]OAA63885.1 hypothetical protein ISF_04594 [Cordyceps fumosorosea ARSEF 2679]